MQSSLKKSLYLGLAALSFASVASATNASSANAAKKHSHKRVAKKVTYKTTNRNLDQSVVFQSTGKNAVFNRPVGKRSVVATKSDMASKANSKSVKDNFMAYQEGVTSKGVHYYKVVSFDKKVRGFVYVGGVNKVDGKTSTAQPTNTTGYLTSNRVFNFAYGSQFGAKLKNFDGVNFTADKFTVKDAVQVRNGAKYYNVTDQANPLVNGWVNADYFSNNVPANVTNAQNDAKAVNVRYVDVNNLGSTLKTDKVQPNGGSYSNGAMNYSNDQFVKSVQSDLVNSGYEYVSLLNSAKDNTSGNNVVNPKQGDTVTVVVKKSDNTNAIFNSLGVKFDTNTNIYHGTTSFNQGNSEGNQYLNPNLLNATQLSELTAPENNSFDFNKIISDIFANGKPWNQMKDSKGKTFSFNQQATMSAYNAQFPNGKKTDGTPVTYSDAKSIKIVYTEDAQNAPAATPNNINTNFTSNRYVNVAKEAVSDLNNVNTPSASFNFNGANGLLSSSAFTNDVSSNPLNSNDPDVRNYANLLNTVKNGNNTYDRLVALQSIINNGFSGNLSDQSYKNLNNYITSYVNKVQTDTGNVLSNFQANNGSLKNASLNGTAKADAVAYANENGLSNTTVNNNKFIDALNSLS